MQTAITSTDAERVPFWSALFRDRRMAPALGLGFTSGMPFLLTYSTQSAWLTDAGVPLATIGLLSELTLAYKFKFVWAPFLDQYDPPLIGPVLGRRRGWLLVAILAVMAMLVGIAFGDPGHWIWWTVGFSVALGVAGATLDLVLDGWRITSVRPPEKQAVLSSWTEIGWRVGNLAAGAGALYLADNVGWKGAYLCMAALMLVGILATLFAPEPPSDMAPHKPHAGFVETVWAPIRDLVKRLGAMAVPILLLVAGFRMPGYVSNAMAVPLFKHQGFTNTDIACRVSSSARSRARPRISPLRFWRPMAGTAARRSGPSHWRSASKASPTPSPRSYSSPTCRHSPPWSMPRASSVC
jgi:PAT family beta-lactamase induction signal transducer AmpG